MLCSVDSNGWWYSEKNINLLLWTMCWSSDEIFLWRTEGNLNLLVRDVAFSAVLLIIDDRFILFFNELTFLACILLRLLWINLLMTWFSSTPLVTIIGWLMSYVNQFLSWTELESNHLLYMVVGQKDGHGFCSWSLYCKILNSSNYDLQNMKNTITDGFCGSLIVNLYLKNKKLHATV